MICIYCLVNKLCPTLSDPMVCSMPGSSVLHYHPEIAQAHIHWVSDVIKPFHILLLPPPLPSVSPSIRVFSDESVLCIRWPNYWSFSFNISPSNEYSVLIFRIDWFDLLEVQGTLESLLQNHNSKASILRCSAYLMVQLSHAYMITGKIIVLTKLAKWCSCFLIYCLGLS